MGYQFLLVFGDSGSERKERECVCGREREGIRLISTNKSIVCFLLFSPRLGFGKVQEHLTDEGAGESIEYNFHFFLSAKARANDIAALGQ